MSINNQFSLRSGSHSFIEIAAQHTHLSGALSLDSYDAGNALTGMRKDVAMSIENIKYFCGLVREVKGETFSMEPKHLNFTRYQPYGVVLKINPFNHPFRFCV